ncbi:hypothetical protein [Candidatus Enterococcus courvalinii]|uniref:MaoC-like domain-containing protein n=1 Tax=Candidatus Enterococcus courvalinii TaxID=2815329 RepID=A0ABS3HXC8_9ENTE|nr:hypothetical protein [Enterococcus sp. MSG2901]MBO0481109.1 hypothetical protein [Enterococcus sp. MSG2901]
MENVEPKYTSEPLAMFSFSETDVLIYQSFSGDKNPIHQTGVIFGIQLMARIEGILDSEFCFNDSRKYSYFFLEKVMVRDTISLYIINQHDFEVWCHNKKVGKGRILNG